MADNKFIKTLEENFEKTCKSYGFQYKNKISNDKELNELLKIADINFVPTSIFDEGYKIKDIDLAKKFLEVNFGCIKNNKDHLTDFDFKSYFQLIDDKIKMTLASTLTKDWPGKKNITDVFKLYYQNTDIKFSELVETFGGERSTNYNKQILKELLNGPNRVVSSIKNNLENTIEIEKISNEKFSEIMDYITDEKNPIPMGHVGGPDSVGFVYMILRRREKISFDDLCRILSFFANNDKEFFDRLSHNIGYVDHCYFDAKVGEKIDDQETIFMDWLLQKVDGKLETDKASTKKILFKLFDKLYKTEGEKIKKILEIMKCSGDLLAVKNDYDKFIKFKKSLESACNKKSKTEFLFDKSNIDDLLTGKIKFEYDIPEYMDLESFFYKASVFPYTFVESKTLEDFMKVFKLNYYPISILSRGQMGQDGSDCIKVKDHTLLKNLIETNISFLEKLSDRDLKYSKSLEDYNFSLIIQQYDHFRRWYESKSGADLYGGGNRLNSNDKKLIERLVNIFIRYFDLQDDEENKFNMKAIERINSLVYGVKLEKAQFQQIWNRMEIASWLHCPSVPLTLCEPELFMLCPEDQLVYYLKKLLEIGEKSSDSPYIDAYTLKHFLVVSSSLETQIELINCILENTHKIKIEGDLFEFLEKEFFNENGCFISFDAKDFDNKTHKPRKYNEAEKKIILEAQPNFHIRLLKYRLKNCYALKDIIGEFKTVASKYENDKKTILSLRSVAINSFLNSLSKKDFKNEFVFFELDNGLYKKLGLFDGDLSDDQRQKISDALVFNIKNESTTGELVDEYKKSIDAKINLLKKMFGNDLSMDLVKKLKSKITGTGITSKYILGELDKITKYNKKGGHDENNNDEQKNIAANKIKLEELEDEIESNEEYKKILFVDDLPKADHNSLYEYQRRLKSKKLYNELKSDVEKLKEAQNVFESSVKYVESTLKEAVNEEYNVPIYERLQKKLDEAFKPVLEETMQGYESEKDYKWRILGQCVADLGSCLYESREKFEKEVIELENDIDRLKLEWQNTKTFKDVPDESFKDNNNKNKEEHDENNNDEQKNIAANKAMLEKLQAEVEGNGEYKKILFVDELPNDDSNAPYEYYLRLKSRKLYNELKSDENLKLPQNQFKSMVKSLNSALTEAVNEKYNVPVYNRLGKKFHEVFEGGYEEALKNEEVSMWRGFGKDVGEAAYYLGYPEEEFEKKVIRLEKELEKYKIARQMFNKLAKDKKGVSDKDIILEYQSMICNRLEQKFNDVFGEGDDGYNKAIENGEIDRWNNFRDKINDIRKTANPDKHHLQNTALVLAVDLDEYKLKKEIKDKENNNPEKIKANMAANKVKLVELKNQIKNNSEYQKCLSGSNSLKKTYDALGNDENLKKEPKIFVGLINAFKDKLDGFVNQEYNRKIYNELLEKFNEVFKGGEETAEKNGELHYFSAFRYNIFESWYLANQPKDVFKKEVDNWNDALNEYELMRENKKNGKDDISVLTGYRAENKKKLKALIDEYVNSGNENKIKAIKSNDIESEIENLEMLVYILSDQNNFEYELKKLRSEIDKVIAGDKDKKNDQEQKFKSNNSEPLSFANNNNMNLNQAAEFNKKDVLDVENNYFESEEKNEDKPEDNINISAYDQNKFILDSISLFCDDKDKVKKETQELLENKALMDSVIKSKELKTCVNEFRETLLYQKENIKKAAGLSDEDLENPKIVLKKLGEAKNNYNKSDEAQKRRIGFSLGIPGAAAVGLGIASVFFPPALIGLAIAGTVTGVSGVTEFCLKLSNTFKSHQMKFVLSKIKPISDILSRYLDKQPKSNIGNQIKNDYGIRN